MTFPERDNMKGPGQVGSVKRILHLIHVPVTNMYHSWDACNTKTQIAFLNNYNIIVEKHVHSHMQVSNCSGVGGSSSVSLLVTDHIGFFKREIGIITDVSPSGEVYLHSSRGV